MGVLNKIGNFLTGGVLEDGLGIIGKLVKDKDLAEKLSHEWREACAARQHELDVIAASLQTEIVKGQTDINKIEAASSSLFKGGWRPAVGWICAFALGYQMLVRPIVAWISGIYAWMPPPSLELETLLTLLFGILGLGAYRTYERRTGVIPQGQ